MFEHGKTGKKYYSVREKINYYNRVIAGKENASAATKRKAPLRLKTLKRLNEQDYETPRLIVTDDKHFGNGISKPRMCVVIKEDKKGRLLVVPIYKRTTKTMLLDRDPDRQISSSREGKTRFIDKSDVYECKHINSKMSLTRYDKSKIKELFK